MAISFYALSRRMIVMQKVSVWGKMLMVVAAATLGTESVDASNPTPTLAQFHTLNETDSLGYAGQQVDMARPHQQNQRWVF
ncbi:hypothetical protein OOJ96_16350 [Pseudomonas sp. 15FMM2]|uniref:Uncharacterized protein n=1 Tax=Pseudomonas imrae TaxID=2992837 RepID=A0ACC7PG57_9PSED